MTALIRLSYVGLGISIFTLSIAFESGIDDFVSSMALIVVAYAPLMTLSMTATLITRERENSTFDQLLTLPVSEWRIVWSKFRSSLRAPIVITFSFILIPYVFALFFNHDLVAMGLQTAYWMPYVLAYLILYSAVAILFSCLCRKNVTAVISAFLVFGGMLLAPPVMMVLYEMAQDWTVTHALGVDRLIAFVIRVIGPFISPYYFLETAVKNWEGFELADDFGFLIFEAACVCLLAYVILRVASGMLALRRGS